ncbi:putative hydro-lyase [Alicyclobacillus tolerans]|uniref:putative hydro-lyase n=1 Tax=Alicyclobacillus tolerans TaxID=90970 RepID=UPI001F01EB95|nr:putative hydro-lyase [Alicyclobacillus tolerans]MCF8568125.1 putative hydro-lyase [Alicyclobacillus tolerans]
MNDFSQLNPKEMRTLIRKGEWTEPTTGISLGYVQANLIILPASLAGDFQEFCRRNPAPLPLLDMTEPGDPRPLRVAPDADLRTDLPRYRIYRNGQVTEEPTNILDIWREDLVAFLLGCSFTTEYQLLQSGVRLRHIENRQNVPMFKTTIQCKSTQYFHGPVVVSMRPIALQDVEMAKEVTGSFPLAHGAPLHIGDPEKIGITNIQSPDWGDPINIDNNEVPVFWACGVTPQAVVQEVQQEFAITHAPGHMFLTDLKDEDIRNNTTEF